jgi:hypothetical protein
MSQLFHLKADMRLEALGRRLAKGRSLLREVSFDQPNGTLSPRAGANAFTEPNQTEHQR